MTASGEALVVVGAGSAGCELAFTARAQGWAGPIVLVGAELHLPYQRPPLSKGYLSGSASAGALVLRPEDAFERAGIALRPGVEATAIDRAAQRLSLGDGSSLGYAALALCTGGRARPLACPGLDASRAPPNLHTLRTRDDADALRAELRPGQRLLIVGGGYIGLEVAASARALGAGVTLIEAEPRVLARVAGESLSHFYEGVHRSHGVELRTGTRLLSLHCDESGAIESAVLDGGERIEVDAVVAGIGMLAETGLAAAAGLETDGGIVVDAQARTADPHIYAAGDCTVQHHALYGRRVRLESVPNALEQARAAAFALCGKARVAGGAPWFWSDQYELKLQMVGLSAGHDEIVMRGDMAARSFVAFYLRHGRLLAADAVNRPADFMAARKLVDAAREFDAVARATLADPNVPLKSLLAPPSAPASH